MIGYRVVQRFYARVHDRYVDPGDACPKLDEETIERLVHAGCLRPVAAGSDDDDRADEDGQETDDGLERLKVADLRELAAKRGLDGLSGAKKAELIDALRADATAGADPEGE